MLVCVYVCVSVCVCSIVLEADPSEGKAVSG